MNWCLMFTFTLTILCHITTGHHPHYEGYGYRPWYPHLQTWSHWGNRPGYMKYDKGSSEDSSDEDSKEWGYGHGGYNNWKNPWRPPGATTTTKTTPTPSTTAQRTTPVISSTTSQPSSRITPSFTSWSKPTPTTPLPVTTIDPFTASCIKSCPVTSEYNPVCGTNNVTYANRGRLECARTCGVDVEVRRASTCAAANAIENPNNGDNPSVDTSTNVTPNWNFGKTTPSLSKVIACLQTCPTTSESNPICGTDGVTYINPSRLLCAQFCGVDVTVRKMSACHLSHPYDNCNIETAPTSASTTPDKGTTSSIYQECIEFCSRTSENNPVCGTNNITYIYISQLMCFKQCGDDVSLGRLSPCSPNINTPSPASTTAPSSVSTERANSLDCISQCAITSEYNPVCGTDNVTYFNIDRLNCLKSCGFNVEVRRLTPCPTDNDSNGGDKNPLPSTSTIGVIEDVSTTTESNDGVTEGFTISPDILNAIFNFSTPTPPNTTTEEEFNIDQRFKTT